MFACTRLVHACCFGHKHWRESHRLVWRSWNVLSLGLVTVTVFTFRSQPVRIRPDLRFVLSAFLVSSLVLFNSNVLLVYIVGVALEAQSHCNEITFIAHVDPSVLVFSTWPTVFSPPHWRYWVTTYCDMYMFITPLFNQLCWADDNVTLMLGMTPCLGAHTSSW